MTQDDFDNLLRLWGYAYGQRRPSEWEEDRSPTGDSPLARGMEFAPGRTVRRLDSAYRRSIRQGEHAWSRDPVPCKETRVAVGAVLAGGSRQFTPEVARVEVAVMELHRSHAELGLAIRAEYCKRGGQGDKARELGIGRDKYREKVAEGRGWLRCKLAA